MKFCHRLSFSSKKETLQLVGGARRYVQGQILAGEGREGGGFCTLAFHPPAVVSYTFQASDSLKDANILQNIKSNNTRNLQISVHRNDKYFIFSDHMLLLLLNFLSS